MISEFVWNKNNKDTALCSFMVSERGEGKWKSSLETLLVSEEWCNLRHTVVSWRDFQRWITTASRKCSKLFLWEPGTMNICQKQKQQKKNTHIHVTKWVFDAGLFLIQNHCTEYVAMTSQNRGWGTKYINESHLSINDLRFHLHIFIPGKQGTVPCCAVATSPCWFIISFKSTRFPQMG